MTQSAEETKEKEQRTFFFSDSIRIFLILMHVQILVCKSPSHTMIFGTDVQICTRSVHRIRVWVRVRSGSGSGLGLGLGLRLGLVLGLGLRLGLN